MQDDLIEVCTLKILMIFNTVYEDTIYTRFFPLKSNLKTIHMFFEPKPKHYES